MFKKFAKMALSVTAAAAVAAALGLTAFAAIPSDLPRSGGSPAKATFVEGGVSGDIHWLKTDGPECHTMRSAGVVDAQLVDADGTMAASHSVPSSILVVNTGTDDLTTFAHEESPDGSVLVSKAGQVDADVVFAGEDTGAGAVLAVAADGVDALIAFAGEPSDGPVNVVCAEDMDGVTVTAAGVELVLK